MFPYTQTFRFEAIERSIALANRSPKGVRRERFIARLDVSMHSNFQLAGSCNFTNRHGSFNIGLLCWQTVKQNNKCVMVHGTGTV